VNADFHFVPSVHVAFGSRPALKAYAAAAGATATIAQGTVVFDQPAPLNASFSSRGPLAAAGGDLLKPDVAAPGQDILAAVAPPGNSGRLFDIYSGTSMASPHVAGVGALLKQLHPDWSPMMIKSALMTTATSLLGSAANTTPFVQGAGQINPNAAADPGLVYDSTPGEWLAFICGTGQLTGCAQTMDPSDLNVPSISIGDLAGVQTVRRTVTNVTGASATYQLNVAAPAGFDVAVSPSTFTIAPNGRQTFDVTITRTTGPLATYRFGSLTWSDGNHSVRIPLVVRPVAFSAPVEVTGTAAAGVSYQIKAGYAGALAYGKRGLVPADEASGTVADDPTGNFDTANPDANQGFTTHDVVVPAGLTQARFSLFDDFTDGEDDLDLYVYRLNADGTKTLVGASGGPTAAEQVGLNSPAAATYRVYVHGFATDGPDANYTLFNWALGTADAGNMTVSGPAAVTIGGTGTVTVSFSGLVAGKKYLGQIRYMEGTTRPAWWLVGVDN
jgi:hypothetical protein